MDTLIENQELNLEETEENKKSPLEEVNDGDCKDDYTKTIENSNDVQTVASGDLFSLFGIKVESLNKEEPKKESSKKSKTTTNTNSSNKASQVSRAPMEDDIKDLSEFNGEVILKAYGNELFRIPGPLKKEDLEGSILERIRNEYGLLEFKKERTIYSFDKESGIVCFDIKFQKKG